MHTQITAHTVIAIGLSVILITSIVGKANTSDAQTNAGFCGENEIIYCPQCAPGTPQEKCECGCHSTAPSQESPQATSCGHNACSGENKCSEPVLPIDCSDPSCNIGPCEENYPPKCGYDACNGNPLCDSHIYAVSCTDPTCNFGACQQTQPSQSPKTDPETNTNPGSPGNSTEPNKTTGGVNKTTTKGSVQGTQKRIIISEKEWLIRSINHLYRLTHFGADPTPGQNRYWLSRISDKPTIPQMYGAMLWQRLNGINNSL